MAVPKTAYTDMLEKWGAGVPWESREVVWKEPHEAYTIEILNSQWDYAMEGFFLAHCLGTKDFDAFSKSHRAYSVRDEMGFPHCTILCAYEGQFSPYGASTDIGTIEPFWPEKAEGPELNVLQVRGRTDDLAMLVFHKMVREWYEERGGKLQVPDSTMDRVVLKQGDDDAMYHFAYMLDESVNHYQWANHNERMREAYRKYGLSL